jgi:hypothetical protein
VFLLFKLIKPLVLVVLLVAAYLYVPLIGTVNGKALHRGVVAGVDGTGAVGAKKCTKRGSKTWRCRVWAESGSEPATFSVRMTDARCWSARLTNGQIGGAPLEQRAKGCLHLRDQLPALPL